MKKLFFLVFILPFCLLAQEVNYLNNPVGLLRQLHVVKIIDSDGAETIIEHTPERMRIYAFSFYYSETYEETTDSNGVYDFVEDTTIVPIKQVTDYYYNSDGLLDSLFDYTIVLDSNKTDTFLVQTFDYSPKGQLKTTTKRTDTYDGKHHIIEKHYFWSGSKIDSIWSYSNALMGTFGTTYLDTLRLDAEFIFVYKDAGQKTQKLRYNKVVETYSYPTVNSIETLEAPRHLQSGCILNSQVSYASRDVINYESNGLVKSFSSFSRKKFEGEAWQENHSFTLILSYEFAQ